MTKGVGLLPADAAADLAAAMQIADPIERLRAIDAARDKAAALHPKLFKKERPAMKLNIPDVRVAFPAFWEAQSIEGGNPKFGGKFVIDPARTALIKSIDDAMLEVAKLKWGPKAIQIMGNMAKTGKKPDVAFVREPYKNKDGDVYDGFEGMYYLSATNAARPLIIDKDKTPLVQADGRPYAGCYVNLNVEFWTQDNTFGRAIRCELRGVQFLRDGDAFGGGTPASMDDFDDLTVADDTVGLV